MENSLDDIGYKKMVSGSPVLVLMICESVILNDFRHAIFCLNENLVSLEKWSVLFCESQVACSRIQDCIQSNEKIIMTVLTLFMSNLIVKYLIHAYYALIKYIKKTYSNHSLDN